jgi:hypothetical protein
MSDIKALYVLNCHRELIFLQENEISNSKELNPDYLSDFFATLQTIAHKIGEEEVKIIDLGNFKFFLTLDKLTMIEFILKCDKDIKPKKVFQVHKDIVNNFIEKFTGNFNASKETKEILIKSFMKNLNQIIDKGEKIEYNLDAIIIE